MTLNKDPLFQEVDVELAKPRKLGVGNQDNMVDLVATALRETVDPEEAMFDFLQSLGMDMQDPNILDTPKRVAKMYREELLSGYTMPVPNLTDFAIDDQGSDQVTVTGIPVHSLCAHHLMPIAGFASVSAFFMPDDDNRTHLLGLSKFARVVEMYSRRLQTQEIIGRQVANFILENTAAVWVGVHIKADHFCMSHRGVRIHGSKTITTKFRRKEREVEGVDRMLTGEDRFYIPEIRSEELKRSFLDEVHAR